MYVICFVKIYCCPKVTYILLVHEPPPSMVKTIWSFKLFLTTFSTFTPYSLCQFSPLQILNHAQFVSFAHSIFYAMLTLSVFSHFNFYTILVLSALELLHHAHFVSFGRPHVCFPLQLAHFLSACPSPGD